MGVCMYLYFYRVWRVSMMNMKAHYTLMAFGLFDNSLWYISVFLVLHFTLKPHFLWFSLLHDRKKIPADAAFSENAVSKLHL